MKRDLPALSNKEYDVVIVGGGIFGICAAWDAALRGLSVALLEKKDFCHASSANHLRMVHGGIRYLQHADLVRVRESCRERSELLRVAPHLVSPLPIVVPTYGHGRKGKEFFGSGLLLYDILTLDRNWNLRDPAQKIPPGYFLSVREISNLYPGLEGKTLTGGAVFYDGQMYSPQRLVLSFLKSAVNLGARAANYAEVTKFLRRHDHVYGVQVQDLLTANQFEIRGKIVLNAAGSWSHRLLESGLGLRLTKKPAFSRDLALLIARAPTHKYGLACPLKSKDADSIVDRGGRHLFAVPWRGRTLLGVWHNIFNQPQEEIAVAERELQGFIDEANEAYRGFDLKLDDVSMILTGLTLFGEEGQTNAATISFGKRSRLIDHDQENHVQGLVTLIGVRATTARGMAEKAVDLILRKLGRTGPKSRTALTPVDGGEMACFEDFLAEALQQNRLPKETITALAHNHGTKISEVLRYGDEHPAFLGPLEGSHVLKAEIAYAVREEMAQKLSDAVFRRTDLGIGKAPGEDTLRICAGLMAAELGWNEPRIRSEIDEVENIFGKRGFLKPENPAEGSRKYDPSEGQ